MYISKHMMSLLVEFDNSYDCGLIAQLMLTMACPGCRAGLLGEVDGLSMTVGSVGWTGITFSVDPVTVNWQLSL